jgi:putative ATPase
MDITKALNKCVNYLNNEFNNKLTVEDNVISYIAEMSGGDLRSAINSLEIAVYSTPYNEQGFVNINIETAYECTQKKILNYDRDGDSHYDILSAFQKSIRGSDVDASLHYLARLIKAGDLTSICRRLLVIASEDIGMAYPNAIVIVKSCVDAAFQLGLPEARINLAQAVITLATSPKSNSSIIAIDSALSELDSKDVGDIPVHLKDSHYEGAKKLRRGETYKYPHNFKNSFINQQYLPNVIKNSKYYYPKDNKFEKNIDTFINNIKNEGE